MAKAKPVEDEFVPATLGEVVQALYEQTELLELLLFASTGKLPATVRQERAHAICFAEQTLLRDAKMRSRTESARNHRPEE